MLKGTGIMRISFIGYPRIGNLELKLWIEEYWQGNLSFKKGPEFFQLQGGNR